MRLLQSSARCRAYVAGRQNGHRQFRSYGARQNVFAPVLCTLPCLRRRPAKRPQAVSLIRSQAECGSCCLIEQPKRPQRYAYSVAVLYVVFHDMAVGNILNLFLSFPFTANLEGVVTNDEIGNS